MTTFRVVPLGDSCLSVVFDARIDPDMNARCVAVASALEQERREGIRDVVPAFHAVAVHFDPLMLDRAVLAGELERIAGAGTPADVEVSAPIEIPVKYGGGAGPDLSSVASFGGCSEDEVVRLHTAAVYRVYMLGFLPGFPYLGSVDPRIAMPRRESPRVRVPAGSVGIAGIQTGIYPCDSPGGWRIIGRTAIRPFDMARAEPFLFAPGRQVKFIAA